MAAQALSIADLQVRTADGAAIIEEIDLEVAGGEILGLVGESGSGKTTTALSLLGYVNEGAEIAGGRLTVAGEELTPREMGKVGRGRLVSYVPQNPGRSLNPSMRVGDAVADMVRAHGGKSTPEDLFATVGLPADADFSRRFPHQVSGGQQQRVCIAVSLASSPPVIVLDEPTTGLDVITQGRILEEIERLRREEGAAMIYISHDLAVVAQIADRIAVMYAGRIVEEGPTAEILARPCHPYTLGLIAAIPDHAIPHELRALPGVAAGIRDRPMGCAFAPRCSQRVEHCEAEVPPLEALGGNRRVRCFEAAATPPIVVEPLRESARPEGSRRLLEVHDLRATYKAPRGELVAVVGASLSLSAGECVALVGESGSGKTTLARTISGLHPSATGEVRLEGSPLALPIRKRTRDQRRHLQMIFQNPREALNPRQSVSQAIARPARLLRGLGRGAAEAEVAHWLESVRLPASTAERYPRELSGGELQRVAIARALAAEPSVIVCDEVTSALDVSVQAAVLSLLEDLRDDLGVGLLFITHDLGVVASIAHQILVFQNGEVCEQGAAGQVLGAPVGEYTRRLLRAAPSLGEALSNREVG